MQLPALSWAALSHNGLFILVAFALALPVAWERELATRLVGLRTLPLVSVACCAYILIGTNMMGSDATAHARLLSGLLAGIGFIGGGAILKTDDHVKGTATAASILATGILGAAVGFGLIDIAVLISLTTLATLWLLRPVERILDKRGDDGADDLEDDHSA
jgi:putative Mg2+ transporter-C (MgtC) family protein